MEPMKVQMEMAAKRADMEKIMKPMMEKMMKEMMADMMKEHKK